MKKKKNFSELVIGVACIALGVAVYIASNGLQKVKLGIGPGGLGGTTTAFAVNIETYPTHIAGLPVAVSICCHVNRHMTRVI